MEPLLYVIMGLNHLREWIAPGYNPEKTPSNEQETFFQLIFKNASFKVINSLFNKTKHFQRMKENTSSEHNVLFDEWLDINAVRNWDKGTRTKYFGTNQSDVYAAIDFQKTEQGGEKVVDRSLIKVSPKASQNFRQTGNL